MDFDNLIISHKKTLKMEEARSKFIMEISRLQERLTHMLKLLSLVQLDCKTSFSQVTISQLLEKYWLLSTNTYNHQELMHLVHCATGSIQEEEPLLDYDNHIQTKNVNEMPDLPGPNDLSASKKSSFINGDIKDIKPLGILVTTHDGTVIDQALQGVSAKSATVDQDWPLTNNTVLNETSSEVDFDDMKTELVETNLEALMMEDNNDSDIKDIKKRIDKRFLRFLQTGSVNEYLKLLPGEIRPYACNTCQYSTKKRHDFVRHIKTHTDERDHLCGQCGSSFKRLESLKQHELLHSGIKSFVCKKCNKSFYRRDNLIAHKLTHLKKKMFMCEICSASFKTEQYLKRHKETHLATEFECEICNRVLKSKDTLRRHKQVHNLDAKYECDLCDMSFMTVHLLKGHKIRHGAKAFLCDLCNRSYYRKSDVELHILHTHDKIKPYECDICQKGCATKNNLRTHKEQVHEKLRPMGCDICGKFFSSKGALNGHIKRHTPHIKDFKCDKCSRAFYDKTDLRKHQEVHRPFSKPFKCDICHQYFKRYDSLQGHIKYQHSEVKPSFACEICGTVFTRQANLNIHKQRVHDGTGRLYNCDICHKAFKVSKDLKAHRRRHMISLL